jgi:hypothetical protein
VNQIDGLIALGIVLIAAVMMAVFAFLAQRSPFHFRDIASFRQIRRAVSMVVEDGSRLHISLGRGSLLTPFGAVALAGLSMLRQLGETTSLSDRPPISTTGDPVINLLAQETLRTAQEAVDRDKAFDATQGRITGMTPFSYVAGAMPYIRDDQVSTNVLIGNYGVEVALLAEAAEREGAAVIAASDYLPAQAVLFVATPSPLIGEELFAAGAYQQAGNFHSASLRVQDIFRWVIIVAILIGILLKLVNLL